MSTRYRLALPVRFTKNAWSGANQWPPIYPTQEQLDEYKEWCKTQVGANKWNYYGIYRKIPCEFRFKCGEDMLAFKLRFGLYEANILS